MVEEAVAAVSPATAAALELPTLLALVADSAATDAGRRRVAELAPAPSAKDLELRRERFEEAQRLLAEGPLVPGFEESLIELAAALDASRDALAGGDLVVLGAMLRATRAAAAAISAADPPCPRLAALAGEAADLEPLRRKIERTLDRRGRVRDDASPRLVELGGTVRRSRQQLYGRLERFVAEHREDLSEETVPLLGGRLVVMLHAGSRGRAPGIVHGRSGTGKSFYFEPLEAVESNNRLQEAQQDEEEERRRLLAELVGEARRAAPEIRDHLALVAELDALQAAARFAAAAGARLAEIGERHRLALVGARHPLLDPKLADLRRRALGHAGHTLPIVPLDVELAAERRVLVVTGPNAGGKTVALKTVGLFALATGCGLPVPAERGTRLPAFRRVVATVGDEQDLLEDRSTFSGRLLRLKEAWEAAGPDALVLLDELGSGTDPEEGTALSIALLEGLLERGPLAVITTHLAPLAAAALEREGAACAAMEFDGETGEPTYRLQPGPPGGSEALALARRLGLASALVDRAEELLAPGHRELRRLLAEVETLRRELRRSAEEAERERRTLAAEREEAERLTREVEEERKVLGRRLKKELESFRRKVAGELRGERERLLERLESGRRRGLVGESVERLFAAAPKFEGVEDEEDGRPLEVGAEVEHRTMGWRGEIEKLSASRVEVRVGGKRLRCAPADLRRLPEAPASAAERPPRIAASPAVAEPEVAAEINLIGRRVEPALEELDRYLDRALLGARDSVRVVHGHGSGRLKAAVREFLRGHPAIDGLRPGRANEGGDGATVAILKG